MDLPNPEPCIDPERGRELTDLVKIWNKKVQGGQGQGAGLGPDNVARGLFGEVFRGPFWAQRLDRTDLIWLLANPVKENLSGVNFARADLKDVIVERLTLACCEWDRAQLDRASLQDSDLRNSSFRRTSLRGTDLSYCQLGGADLRNAQLDSGTDLSFVNFGYPGGPRAWLVDVGWNSASLAQIGWQPLKTFQTGEDVRADLYQRVLNEAKRSRQRAKWCRLILSIARRLYLVSSAPARLIRRHSKLHRMLHAAVRPLRRVLKPLTSFVRNIAIRLRLAFKNAPKYRSFTQEQVHLVAEGIGFKALQELGAGPGRDDDAVDWAGLVSSLSDSPEQGREADDELSRKAGRAFNDAVRVNTQLATELRSQGLSPEADHFAFAARQAQQRVWRLNGNLRRAVANRTLRALCGYGFRPGLLLLWYAAINTAAVIAYLFVDRTPHQHPGLLDAITLSLTAFHGRGFVASGLSNLTAPTVAIAAVEAVVGLFIEATFVGTFVQRVLT